MGFSCQRDRVALECSGCLALTENLFPSGPGRFAYRALAPGFSRIFFQFIGHIKRRCILRDVQSGTDPKGINRRIRLEQRFDPVLVKAAAQYDFDILALLRI